jgi:hypothetical protein
MNAEPVVPNKAPIIKRTNSKTQKLNPKPAIPPEVSKKARLQIAPESYSSSSSSANRSSSSSSASSNSSDSSSIKSNDSDPISADDQIADKVTNQTLLDNEDLERKELQQSTPEQDEDGDEGINRMDYLYPSLNDSDFNLKITSKKEFNDTKYEGIKTEKNVDGELVAMDVEEYSEILNNAPFELQPHQAFVKNFLSLQTPYNSLLLYHGLGSGKTCSAIGVCEEHRDYLKQMGISKKIIIVAAPNVQDNFRLQLFDERKLVETNGIWNIRACTGSKMLKEINPTNLNSLSKEAIVKQVTNIINTYYLFVGYIQFSNMIEEVMSVPLPFSEKALEEDKQKHVNKLLSNAFSSSLVVIDEVHNIRIANDNASKTTAINLMKLADAHINIRFLLLSATPMYNNYTEIIWLLNLMNVNDNRGAINIRDVFEKDGNFKMDMDKPEGEREVGKALFIKKCSGYISFVRGENPYTFPFRIYPELFAPARTFSSGTRVYPLYQMNGKPINPDSEKLKTSIIPVFLTNIGEQQLYGYKCIMDKLRTSQLQLTNKAMDFDNMESFGYVLLQKPLQALNMVYPVVGLKEVADSIPPISMQQNLIKQAIKDSEQRSSQGISSQQSSSDESDGSETTSTNPSERAKALELNEEMGQTPDDDSEEVVVTDDDSNSSSDTGKSAVGGKPKGVPEAKPVSYKGIKLSDLTGKSGLRNAMKFDDNASAGIKGNFEYKPAVEKNFGRFFSRQHIHKYSSKIASICNAIYPEATGELSKGIILIYSQYIDSGLIPIALALEELGFTRYGKDSKSLLKTPPQNPTINLRAKGGKQSLKYVMITGDKKLSKNNDADVKAVTDENNKNGEKIKVVLISSAGSEGIDLKYIRQVHILDPWYNMNRIEQIIGRGVRNFSHKGLPFVDHNVEIFLYATLLTVKKEEDAGSLKEESKEESADLYVYRVAERKAIQIGNVSRLLKETAVDCILNYKQTTFTQDQFKKLGQKPVDQSLSYVELPDNNSTISYEVGDVDDSSTCDYMKCTTTCKKLDENEEVVDIKKEEIDEMPVTENTYSEKFIVTNSEKIIQKVKDIFSLYRNFFYTKKHFKNLINTPKNFPMVHIYAALSQLINDKNEYILDFYGRTGHLINVGDYYLFKPSELNFNNYSLSAYNIVAPLDNKFSSIKINTGDAPPQQAVHDTRNVQKFAKNKFGERLVIDEEDDGDGDSQGSNRVIGPSPLDKIKQRYHIALFAMDEYSKIANTCPTDDELEEYSNYMTLQNKFRQRKVADDLTSEQNARLKVLSVKLNKFKKDSKQIIYPEQFTENDAVDFDMFTKKERDGRITKTNEQLQFDKLKITKLYSDNLLGLTHDPNDYWYNYCGVALHKLKTIPFDDGDIPDDTVNKLVQQYVIAHAIDTLPFAEKLALINMLHNKRTKQTNGTRHPTDDEVEKYAREYLFNSSKIIKKGRKVVKEYMVLFNGKTKIEKNDDDDNRKLIVLQGNKWINAPISESKDFNTEIRKLKEEFKQQNMKNHVNKFIGFIGYENKGKFLLFKTKDITNERNLAGARCDQTSKSSLLKYLNELVETRAFTEITTKLSGQQELCAMQEIIMRYFNDTSKNNKLWFFPPELTELYNLEHCKVKNSKLICKND